MKQDAKWFDEEFFQGTTGLKGGDRRKITGHQQVLATVLAKTLHGKRFLEAGCGLGGVVKSLQDIGERANGIELGQWAVDNAHCPGIEQGALQDLIHERRRWDVVVCWNVLAYLPEEDVDVALRGLKKVAREVVILSIVTPERHTDALAKGEVGFPTAMPLSPGRKISQPYEWWEAKFKENGLYYNEPLQEKLRRVGQWSKLYVFGTVSAKWYDKTYYEKTGVKSGFDGGADSGLYYSIAVHLHKSFPEVGDILDVGCGKGFLVQHLTNLGYRAEGTDFSAYAVKNAVGKVKQADILHLKQAYKRKRFDLAVSWQVLEHIQPHLIPQALGQIYGILRKGGYFVMTLPVVDDGRKEISHYCIKPREWWIAAAEKVGFVCDENKRQGFGQQFGGVSEELFVFRK